MKIALKTILSFSFALGVLFLVGACSSAGTGEKVEAKDVKEAAAAATVAAQTLNVNTGTSLINWSGKKSIGGGAHAGTLALKEGTLSVEGGQLTAGSFVIDMGSMKNTDIEDEGKAGDLVGHLSSPDFFNVPAHPTATFEITKVDAVSGDLAVTHNITGNLTLLGITKQVTLPANVAVAGGKLTATTSSFVIDRTEWGIKYGSDKIVDLAKDKIISSDIGLKIVLNAAI